MNETPGTRVMAATFLIRLPVGVLALGCDLAGVVVLLTGGPVAEAVILLAAGYGLVRLAYDR